MHLRSRKTILGAAAIFTAAIASAAFAQSGMRLIVNGETASTSIRIINGQPYVPLADMAKAMHGKTVKSNGNYVIQMAGTGTTTPGAAGGANEVRGTSGQLGTVIFNGKWRFSALSVDHTDAYDSKYLPGPRHFTPNGPNDELVVVNCKAKNGVNSTQKLMLSSDQPHNTALTDADGQSYGPLAFDKRTDSTNEGPSMLPGSQTEFAIVFSVPKGTNLKDLVFSVQTAYADYPNGGTDVRISLAP